MKRSAANAALSAGDDAAKRRPPVPLTAEQRSAARDLATRQLPMEAGAVVDFVRQLDVAAPRPPADADALASVREAAAAYAAGAGRHERPSLVKQLAAAIAALRPFAGGALTFARLFVAEQGRQDGEPWLPRVLPALLPNLAPGSLARGTEAGDELREDRDELRGGLVLEAWWTAVFGRAEAVEAPLRVSETLWRAGVPASPGACAVTALLAARAPVGEAYGDKLAQAVRAVASARGAVGAVLAAWLATPADSHFDDCGEAGALIGIAAAAGAHLAAVVERLKRACRGSAASGVADGEVAVEYALAAGDVGVLRAVVAAVAPLSQQSQMAVVRALPRGGVLADVAGALQPLFTAAPAGARRID
jgi:hypothetical protein